VTLLPGYYYIASDEPPFQTFADHTTAIQVTAGGFTEVIAAYFTGQQWVPVEPQSPRTYGPLNALYYVKALN
jgi:hypothetical protein